MGAETIWYTEPFGSSVMQTVSLTSAEAVNIVQPTRTAIAGAQRNGYGRMQTVYRGQLETFRIEIKQVAEGSALRHLRAVCEAMRHGASIGFSDDSAKAYLAYTTSPRAPGDTLLVLASPGATMHGLGTATLASGDAVAIESLNRGGVQEMLATSASVSATATTMTVAGGLRYTHPIPGWVRYVNYYPILVLNPAEQPSVTYDESTNLWDVSIPAIPDWGAVEGLRENGGIVWTGTSPFVGAGRAIDDLLALGGGEPRFLRGGG